MEIFETRIVPSHSMKRRGYKYKTPDELIDNKDDPEFTLPMFELNLDCSSKRNAMVCYINKFARKYFTGHSTGTTCFAIEILDRVMLTVAKLSSNYDLQIIGGACLYLDGIDFNFKPERFVYKLLESTEKSEDMIINCVSIILDRLENDVSYEYSVMWFINWLGGFKHIEYKNLLKQRILDVYISGEYRTKDPYTMAYEIMLSV